jgi:hypothetical protein
MRRRSAPAVAALAALALAASSSAASVAQIEGWTVTRAERAARLIRYVDDHEVKVARDNLAWVKKGCPTPQVVLDDAGRPVDGPIKKGCTGAKQKRMIAENTRELQVAQRGYAPSDVTCRSDSPSKDSYHFTRFRCRLTYDGPDPRVRGTAVLVVKDTTRFVWWWA